MLNSIGDQIKVKSEPDDGDEVKFETMILNASKEKTTNSVQDIQKNHATEVLSLKKFNNELFFELQKAKETIKLLENENQNLKSEMDSITQDFVEKLHLAQNELTEKAKEKDAELLKRKESSNDESDNFDVDQIIGHKKKRKTRYYLVRWTNYDHTHDSWVAESNLSCPKILNTRVEIF